MPVDQQRGLRSRGIRPRECLWHVGSVCKGCFMVSKSMAGGRCLFLGMVMRGILVTLGTLHRHYTPMVKSCVGDRLSAEGAGMGASDY